jgi:ADP-ribosylglycohydrolase
MFQCFHFRDNEDAGVGSLMRLAPVPIRHHANIEAARSQAAMSSLTTHPGLLAAECCSFVAHLVVRAINRGPDEVSVSMFIDDVVCEYIHLLENKLSLQTQDSPRVGNAEEGVVVQSSNQSSVHALTEMLRLLKCQEPDESTERCWNWKNTSLEIDKTVKNRGLKYNGYPVMRGYFGSFCMDGLSMALWSVYHTSSFDLALERCVNLLGDADSTGAVAGQIAGAFYGASAVSPEMIRLLEQWDNGDTALRGALLYHIGNKALKAHEESK